MVKALLDELNRVRTAHGIDINLDEGLLGIARDQMIEGLDL